MARLNALTSATPRAVIYVRQSTYKEESISLELQELACRDYCDRLGYEIVAVEEDPGVSGRTWNRPGVQTVMTAIEDRRADVIVLWKWSRLSRSRKDWALAIDRCDIAGGRIESATEPIDTATASGRFARGVMTEFSAYQSELIGEIWEDVRQRRLRLGLPASGRLPYGWRWVKGEGIEQDPDRASVVVEMYRRYLAGDGAAAIAQWLNEQRIPGPNGNPWTRVRPLTVLDSPIHAGLIPYRGEVHPGAHEPIIPRETWEAFLEERARRRETGAKPRNYDHLLSTLVRCECGARMHGKGSITAGKWYGGYICSDTLDGHPLRGYVSSRRLDRPVVDWLMTFDPEVRPRRDDGVDAAKRERVNRAILNLEGELDELTRQLGQKIVPEAAYLRATAKISDEIAALRATLPRVKPAAPSVADLATLRRTWPAMTTTAKNRALREMIDRIEIRRDGAEAILRTTWGDSSVLHL
jgi:site-specific DNA recombinase